MKKRALLLFLVSILFLHCGGGNKDEEVNVEKLKFVEQKDIRQTAEPPLKLKNGYNFSVLAPRAKYVSLVGDFNNWLDNRHPMEKNEFGVWSITIALKKGVYSYKFNIDGAWVIDQNNSQIVKDSLGDRRSLIEITEDTAFYREPVYFGYTNAFAPLASMSGILFTYNDKMARHVYVSGTFNNWEKEDFPLEKNINGIWHGYVQIPKGDYFYKFAVDGLWKHDPANPERTDDGYGDYKSGLRVLQDIEDRPDKPLPIDYEIVRFKFYNRKLPSQYTVSVIGDFNGWQTNLNIMTDDDFNKEWFTTVRLQEGEYYYKFFLAGRDFFDPENEVRKISPEGKEANYLKIVTGHDQLNIKFTYFNPQAGKVNLAGDFNNWDVEADAFQKDQYGLWYVVKKLTRGRYLYQYVVDNRWMPDINNPYTALDANGDMNSYLEIK
ncbi:MAG: hypothetical protein PHF84_12830 [bacterium]|nr:hypothetical protein [bacterium]